MKVPIGFSGFGIRLISRSAFEILKGILGARFGIERMYGMQDAANNPRDYGIGENLGRDHGIKEPSPS